MSRHVVRLLVLALFVSSPAAAETFGGWRYSAPPGYTIEEAADHVSLTKVTTSGFCSIALFEPRMLDSSLAVEQAYEWHNIVTHQFKASVKRRNTLTVPAGEVVAATAKLTDEAGTTFGGTHYMVMMPGMIGSVLVTAPSVAALASCKPATGAVLQSLEIDWTAPRFNDPEARVETPLGRWAALGETARQYTFASNGIYRFHSETSGPEPIRVIDETGTFKLVGNRIVLVPQSATLAIVANGVGKIGDRKLEKTTYAWRKRYVPATNEWRIVLTPTKATARDGELPAGTAGYQYSDSVKPGFRYASQPGA